MPNAPHRQPTRELLVWMIAQALGAALSATGLPAFAATPQPKATTQFYTPHIAAATTPMHVEVLNGDSFRDIATNDRYRLYGVDVCAAGQKATLDKTPWSCGAVADAWLTEATLGQWVVCTTIRDDERIKIARCATSQYPDIAREMLNKGIAIMPTDAADRAIPDYQMAQTNARTRLLGLWGSKFQMPWDFRKSRLPAPPPSVSPDIPTLPKTTIPAAPKVTLPPQAPPAQ